MHINKSEYVYKYERYLCCYNKNEKKATLKIR